MVKNAVLQEFVSGSLGKAASHKHPSKCGHSVVDSKWYVMFHGSFVCSNLYSVFGTTFLTFSSLAGSQTSGE